ncbi:MAG: FHA domain-containing protein [Candidatus Aminicenantes bacterium]|nr:FHA domain-containing protein [Candidatus Aminicenantes bacterium]NIM79632.1 FHA domain-containing protein [Candidatus Aminicenantes bacterium]NIN18958.1 FHA domain-containing protein [Candidatus Aminicenantes bacterium]NIN42860.1 FHA domain-containing protein [Candidatus Aminicenantes bacterium]NIN85597.1 FHA domain-containing protein [Candidatus Aminicenantes bacterium]
MARLYLLYTREGFSKKFPLLRPSVKIGRDADNDLVIDDDFISRRHVDICVNPDSIVVQDAGSKNGFFVDNERKEKAKIKIEESFKIGDVTFTLRRGETDEFSLSEKFQPDSDLVKETKDKEGEEGRSSTKTRALQTIYKEIEEDIFKRVLLFGSFDEFASHLSARLSEIPNFGTLFLVEEAEKEVQNVNIRFSVNGSSEAFNVLKKIMAENPLLFQNRLTVNNTNLTFRSEPVNLRNKNNVLVYFPRKSLTKMSNGRNIESFLLSLAKSLDLLDNILEEKKHLTGKKEKVNGNDEQRDMEIITNSEGVRDLIKQAKKIAESDIFILIEGESGTGKELFARLIHRHSQRHREKFVALNCAAIPENLLESELFGYEKGAFTGAYNRKPGKLELASRGTLVLDEIGDMPLNLQSKLLRAIQENEFYRLGGSTPIKVDLRIISLTHQNIEKLIEEKKFREDLYYRLVHRILTIPPLRERKEDIPSLINFFTNKFCRQKNRSINGYSVKAFEALVNFDWKGNVRQLENEINSIVNLTNDGETVDFDILSEKIKNHYEAKQDQSLNLPPRGNGFYKKPEREEIIEILKKHNWNKSKAARELNMTYHGLHKRMKKMKIKPPELS